MDTIATKEARKSLLEVYEAIDQAVAVAKSKPEPTCQAIAAILLSIQGAIQGGGIGEWVEFGHQFAIKQIKVLTEDLKAKSN